jgi:hypothetical protein
MRQSVMRHVDRDGLDRERAEALLAQRLPAAVECLLADLDALFDADVDVQRTNPLAVIRQHLTAVTTILDDLGATVPQRDPFDQRIAPDDRYAVGPATWADVDVSLAEPGLVWGAWKAALILQRRRDEGLR